MLKFTNYIDASLKLINKQFLFKMLCLDVIAGKFFGFKIYYKTIILNNKASLQNNFQVLDASNGSDKYFRQIQQLFIHNDGQFYISSIEFGGAFSYLKNKSETHAVLIFNPLSSSANQYSVEFMFLNIHYVFSCTLTQLLHDFNISKVVVNHLIWLRELSIISDIIALSKVGIQVVVIVHDYFYICPSFNLLNHNGEYCKLPESNACNNCFRRLSVQDDLPELALYRDTIKLYQQHGKLSPALWRARFTPLFNCASSIVFPSNAAKSLFLKIYPEFSLKSTVVKHDLQYLTKINPVVNSLNILEPMCVAVMGDIKYHKGLKILEELVQASNRNLLNVSFLIIGSCRSEVLSKAKNTIILNEYTVGDLNSILATHKVNLFLFLSIWPETFSFVTHEMMQTQLPILAFNLGAPGDFIANYNNGVLVNDISFSAMYAALLSKYNQYKNMLPNVSDIAAPFLLSVVMATYNGEKYLREQLDSILAQTVPAHEIIVVDDCSTDNTWLILNDYATSYAQIKIYQNSENYGIANTFDYALSLARGEYIALADQDDFWVPQKLEVLIKQIGDNLLIHSDAYVVNDKLQIISSSFLGTKAFTKKISNYFVFNDVHGCTALIRRELLDLALPIPAGFYLHDHYLAIFAAALKKITYVDQPLIFYRQHEANVVGINKIDDYQEYQTHFKVLLDSLQLLTHQCFKESSELECGVDFYHSNLLNKPAKFKTYWWYVRNFSISRSIFFIGRTCFGVKIGRLMFKLRNRIQ